MVAVEPVPEVLGALCGGGVGVRVGPLAECGLDEAFGFAVGTRGEGPGEAMAQALLGTARIEGPGTVTPAVVGEHAADTDAEAAVVVEGGAEEGRGSGGGLVGIELGEGEAGVVVDADMEVFPAGAGAGVAAVPGEAVTGAVKAAEFLDVEVQQVARVGMFVAADGRRRVEGTEASKALAVEDPTDGGGRHPDGSGDLSAGPAQPAQGGDATDDSGRYAAGRVVRTRAAVEQTVGALGPIAGYPLAHGARTDSDGVGHRRRGLALVEDRRTTAARLCGVNLAF